MTLRSRLADVRRSLRPQPVPPVVGIVERFTARQLVGWVSVPADLPPAPVDLYVGPHLISSTYPTAGVPLSGMEVVKEDGQAPRRSRGSGITAGPRDDRRHSPQEVRVFSFQVQGLWAFLGRRARVSVRFRGQVLPIAGHGMWLSPRRAGDGSIEELLALLASGHKLSKSGSFVPPLEQNASWGDDVAALFGQTRTVLAERGLEPFLVYGSLLGHVRDGGPISHDNDFDAAYISSHATGEDVAGELVEIALELRRSGLVVDLRHRLLHIHDPESGRKIDLFHSWFDDADNYRITWGVAGTTPFRRADWHGTEEVDFAGGRFLAPRQPERLLAHLYGEDWRLPKPGFNWNLSRVDAAEDGVLTTDQRTKVYWANFYATNEYRAGSTFFEFVNAHPAMPATVVDIGCGDGRDACAFGAAGRRVLGLDQSPVGIEHAREKAAGLGLEEVAFEVCDVADEQALGAVLDRGAGARSGPVLFYLRFFLHAINEEIQERLLAAVRTHARPGDLFAAEFRTDKDSDAEKVHGNHYRRFQNAEAFRERLVGTFGFDELLFEIESTGLSPYRGEDPVLYRVIARRTA
ncbi:class I SAM-dependent methyltransferase [Nocardioides daejeonensis]|uniref:class I SAM-dependent methyltransferase n=1 Tax=Nocardioides daejeonensis TaxID=1046556 RepID=UPI000D744490|nr:class I SAM-dependent methyltransferase [Nocardioides daejeonensis]